MELLVDYEIINQVGVFCSLITIILCPSILCFPFSNTCHPIAVDSDVLSDRKDFHERFGRSITLSILNINSEGSLYSSQVVMEAPDLFHWWEITQRMEQDALPYFSKWQVFSQGNQYSPFSISGDSAHICQTLSVQIIQNIGLFFLRHKAITLYSGVQKQKKNGHHS